MRTVPQTEIVEKEVYKIEKEVRNLIENQVQVHTEYVDRPVPVENIVQYPVEITKTIEVPTYIEVEKERIKEVTRTEQVPIIQRELQVVEKEVPVPFREEVLVEKEAIV